MKKTIKQRISKEARNLYKNIRNFRLSRALKEQVADLSFETDKHVYELSKLKHEIKRLMDIVSAQEELIAKTPFLSNQIPNIRKPQLKPNKNPVKLIKNYLVFQKELKAYRKAVEESGKE